MAKHDITYTCGHTERLNFIESAQDRERRIAWLERGTCYECYRQAALHAAHTAAQSQGLPPLTGTERQIAWAETVRVQKMAAIVQDLQEVAQSVGEAQYARLTRAVDAIRHETSAHRWIEWRDLSGLRLIQRAYAQVADHAPVVPTPSESAMHAEVLAEATIRPAKVVTETVAELTLQGKVISVAFPEKREDFRQLVRFTLHYTWREPRWERTIKKFAGPPADRLVELGHRILALGIPVRTLDNDLRSRIIVGDYAPECTRWIARYMVDPYKDWFVIRWQRPDDFYDAAKRLPGSRYEAPYVVVPAQHFDRVLDFAAMYQFSVSEAAQSLADEARALRDKALIIAPPPVSTKEPGRKPSKKPQRLAVPEAVTVADAFRDDP